MGNKTLYVKDEALWNRARELAGDEGLSGIVSDLLRDWVQRKETQRLAPGSEEMQEIRLWVGGTEHEDPQNLGSHYIALTGRLIADSEGYSLDQVPRVKVYETKARQLVVYRSWLDTVSAKSQGATYTVYRDYEDLERNRWALDTAWIEFDKEEFGDHTLVLMRDIARALGRELVIRLA